ncbi:MAG: glutamate--tRNA ligase, partial [Pseudomonadota bacterium]
AHYMRTMTPSTLIERMMAILPEMENGTTLEASLTPENRKWLEAGIPALSERAKTLVELWQAADFVLAKRPIAMEDKALALASGENRDVLRAIVPILEAISDWNHDNIDSALRQFCDNHDLKLGKVAQPIRAALTGKASSPGAFDVLLMLGKDEALLRLSDRL